MLKPCYIITHATLATPTSEPNLPTATSEPSIPNPTSEPSLPPYIPAPGSSRTLSFGDTELEMLEVCKRQEVEVENKGVVVVEEEEESQQTSTDTEDSDGEDSAGKEEVMTRTISDGKEEKWEPDNPERGHGEGTKDMAPRESFPLQPRPEGIQEHSSQSGRAEEGTILSWLSKA